MKKRNTALVCTVTAMSAFVPICVIFSSLIGYNFELWNYTAAACLFTVLLVISDIFLTVTRNSGVHKFAVVLSVTTPFFTLFNLFFYLSKSKSSVIIAIMFLAFLSSAYLSCITVKKLWFGIIYGLLIAITIWPICVLFFVNLFMGDFGATTVVRTVESPSGEYRAEVIDNSEGALGGSTQVLVYGHGKSLNLYFFRFSKYPTEVYFGDWGEFYNMKLEWTDDERLYINGKEVFSE